MKQNSPADAVAFMSILDRVQKAGRHLFFGQFVERDIAFECDRREQ